MIDASFSLVDQDGNPTTEQTYRGRWMLVYFGFTNCRVVCPRSLAKLSTALESLGSRSEQLVPLYITVDPDRDTPAVMKAWLGEHYPRFAGLTGTQDQVAAAKAAFRVFAQRKADAEDPDGYAVPHTAITYLIDPQGKYRAHFVDALDQGVIADRIMDILSEEDATSDV